MPPISSLQNPRVKAAAKLRDRRERDKQGRILVDGIREITRALDAGVEILELFVCQSLSEDAPSQTLLERVRQRSEVRQVLVTQAVMEKLAYGDRAEGLLAVAIPPETTLQNLESRLVGSTAGKSRVSVHNPKSTLLAIIEGAEKPGNIGAILRSADATGVSGVIVADGGTDTFNPNVIRASLGAVFSVPVAAASSAQALAWLRRQGIRILTARVGAAVTYSAADYSGRLAIALGSEAHGLSPIWAGPDITDISLPMLGKVDSLNLSTTAAVLFYEALRQRSAER